MELQRSRGNPVMFFRRLNTSEKNRVVRDPEGDMRETIMMGLLCSRIKSHQAIRVEKLKAGIFREDVKACLPRVGFVQRSTVATAVDSPCAFQALLALDSCEYRKGAVGA